MKASDKNNLSVGEIILLIAALNIGFWLYHKFAPSTWSFWADFIGLNGVLFSVIFIWKLFINRLGPFKTKGN